MMTGVASEKSLLNISKIPMRIVRTFRYHAGRRLQARAENYSPEIHQDNTTKLSYRLAWARHYLTRFGLLQNSERGLWAFTATG